MALALTEELKAECEQMLALCKEMRQLEPDVEVPHHIRGTGAEEPPLGAAGCGCPWVVDQDTGLYDQIYHRAMNSSATYDKKVLVSAYDTDYPFFICAHCKNLVPWCYGCDHGDEYLAACCDECWDVLTKGGQDDVVSA